MKTVILKKNSQISIIEEEKPKAAEDFVVVQVHSAPMCTEFYLYSEGKEDLCLGHEAAGEVVEVAQAGKVKVGDRVVVMPQYPCGKCSLCISGNYIHCENIVDPLTICGCKTGLATYSQYVLKQDWLLLPIPDDMSYDHASMACCGLGASFGALNLMDVGPYDTVLITGLGPVGMGAIVNCMVRGARVIGVARNSYRSKLALELGAETILNPEEGNTVERIKQLTGGFGADKSIDCSGGEKYQLTCVRATRRKGHVAFVGESEELSLQVSNDLIRNGLTLHGAWHWNLTDAEKMMKTIARSCDLINKLITHCFALDQVEEAFKTQINGNCGKVILHP